jgi:hypothetical protein
VPGDGKSGYAAVLRHVDKLNDRWEVLKADVGRRIGEGCKPPRRLTNAGPTSFRSFLSVVEGRSVRVRSRVEL